MAKKSNGSAKAKPEGTIIAEPGDPATPNDDGAIDQDVIDLAVETLTGDVRDAFLAKLRHEQDKRPWDQRGEDEQARTIMDAEAFSSDLVTKVVELIAANGRRVIRANLDKVQIKDEIQGVVTMSKHDECRHLFADAVGHRIIIVVADPEAFTGERGPVAVNPEQGDMLRDSMADHSEADDNHADDAVFDRGQFARGDVETPFTH